MCVRFNLCQVRGWVQIGYSTEAMDVKKEKTEANELCSFSILAIFN